MEVGSLIYSKNRALEETVMLAKEDRLKSEKLICDFKPFIASVIQKRVGRYLEYDINKGKFLSFARLVIINRLIDYFRRQTKIKTVPLNYNENFEDPNSELIDKKAVSRYTYQLEEEDRKYEIIEYSRILKEWGIKFEDLVKVCPKQESLRNEYINLAKIIASNNELLQLLKKNKRLPIKEIEKLVPLHRKKIERGRIYIIALILAITNNYSFIDI